MKKEREHYFREWKKYVEKLKEHAKKILNDKDVQIVIFGSLVEKKYHPMLSDIDVLVISKNAPMKGLKRGEILDKLYKIVGYFSPFQIHLVTPELYKNWYKKFIKKKVEI